MGYKVDRTIESMPYSKEAEIKVIEWLFDNDSYFTDGCKIEDKEQIISNIKNDFQFFHNTTIGKMDIEHEKLEKEFSMLQTQLDSRGKNIEYLEADLQKAKEKIKALQLAMLAVVYNNHDHKTYLTISSIVRFKVINKIELDSTEKKYLLKRLSDED